MFFTRIISAAVLVERSNWTGFNDVRQKKKYILSVNWTSTLFDVVYLLMMWYDEYITRPNCYLPMVTNNAATTTIIKWLFGTLFDAAATLPVLLYLGTSEVTHTLSMFYIRWFTDSVPPPPKLCSTVIQNPILWVYKFS